MFYNRRMNSIVKLKDIAVHMDLEPAEEVQLKAPSPPNVAPCGQVVGPAQPAQKLPPKKDSLGITHAALPGGKTVPLLKTLLTSACERNCYYCPFRAGRSYRRHTFSPEEMAKTFMDVYRAGMVQGLFLSSGIIKGGVATQDRLLDTVAILRHKHNFPGYIHLKIMPGAEKDQIFRAMQLADRLSVNLEAPNARRLADLAPKKIFYEELLRPLQWIDDIRRNQPAYHSRNGRWPSSTTQFVVGAVEESDLELLIISELLIKKSNLSRVYYSAFTPIKDTPLENHPAENPLRQHRLYQSSFLLRDYGFDMEELPFDAHGNLPLEEDPKVAWAQRHLLHDPVEVNRAAPEDLLRVPGIGSKSMHRIVAARRHGRLRHLADLQAIGVRTRRLAPYVQLDGKRPMHQMRLF